jgi:hypothetical protein
MPVYPAAPEGSTNSVTLRHIPPKVSRIAQFAGSLLRLPYAAIRPIVRPIAWRLRGFLLLPVLPQLSLIRLQLTANAEAIEALRHAISKLREISDEKIDNIAHDQKRQLGELINQIDDIRNSLDKIKARATSAAEETR